LHSIAELDRLVAEIVFLGTGSRVTVNELAGRLRASPTEIRQTLSRLSKLGYPFILRAGLIERQSFEPIDLQQLRADFSPKRVGRRIEWRLHVRSTQDELKMIEPEAEDGTVLLGETQDSGRGRLTRSWFAPFGGIWMSILLRPKWQKSHQVPSLAFAASVAKAISTVTGLSPLVKWPNDVTVGSRKVAGILAEGAYSSNRLDRLIVGLGVNANMKPTLFPKELRGSATSLSQELGHQIDRNLLTRKILEEIDNAYGRFESGAAGELLDEARMACSTVGRKVKITSAEGSFEGEAVDVGDDGELLLRLRSGAIVRFYAADVIHIR